MYKYRNKSDTHQLLVGVTTDGAVAPGAEIIVAEQFNNPNFEFIDEVVEQPAADAATNKQQLPESKPAEQPAIKPEVKA